MTTSRSFSFERFQHWRRPFEIGFWVVTYVVNAIFNSVTAVIDHPQFPAWQPAVWECSSHLIMLMLVPVIVVLERRWPIRFDTWTRNVPRHLLASVPYSMIHVLGMIAVRKVAYRVADSYYTFGPSLSNFGYEYLKDVRTYFGIVVTLILYRLWLMRQQGEARLLSEPETGLPVEPVDRPERFLVRKLGKEFLLAAREIEWLQASGNYVNLHVRGRDYPLRATMSGIETRLDTQRFVRVHRSYVVNLDYLAEIEPLETGDARLIMRDGVKIPCSRRYRAALRERFGQPVAAD
jgi:hypothetical protein